MPSQLRLQSYELGAHIGETFLVSSFFCIVVCTSTVSVKKRKKVGKQHALLKL